MANITLFRGGTPVFRPAFCCGDYPEFMPPVDTPHYPGTPPYDSHADAARGQGYLNLSFPFVPNLLDTTAHRWMHVPLKKLSAVDDVIQLIWVPLRGYIESMHIELTRYDSALDGVYVRPWAQRAVWDFAAEEWTYIDNIEFDNAITSSANNDKINLGTPVAGDVPYILARFPQIDTAPPATFGHNLVQRDASGKPVGGLDEYYGAVILGLKIIAGDPAKIADLWRGKFELWYTAKFIGFECHTFTG